MDNKQIPNPGSKKAVEMGCLCPVMDNHFGKGVPGQGFWVNGECPLHGLKQEENENK